VFDGITFDSKHERDRYVELTLLEKAKVIQDLKTQVSFPLIPKSKYGREIKYVADFTYYENGELVVEDTKSPITKTPVYRLKKRLMAEKYDIVIKET
jgi:hypothetical protein